MLQGAAARAQKCRNTSAPNFLQGLYDVRSNAMQGTPRLLQGVMLRTQQCHTSITSKGAISASRQRHFSHAPTSFIWSHTEVAEMSIRERSKGRVTSWSQQCHLRHTLPTQFNGVIVKTQKCQDIVAPREKPYRSRRNADVVALLPSQFNGDTDMTQQCLDHNSPRERSNMVRRNAPIVPPLPTSLTGAITTSQKCYKVNAPREGSTTSRRNANRGLPFPTIYRGPYFLRRSAIVHSPPPNLGHRHAAEMPLIERPITRGQPFSAIVPTHPRLAT